MRITPTDDMLDDDEFQEDEELPEGQFIPMYIPIEYMETALKLGGYTYQKVLDFMNKKVK